MGARKFVGQVGAAEYLDVAEQTLANWRYIDKNLPVEQRRGPRYFKVGASVKYDLRDLDAWLEEHASVPRPAA